MSSSWRCPLVLPACWRFAPCLGRLTFPPPSTSNLAGRLRAQGVGTGIEGSAQACLEGAASA